MKEFVEAKIKDLENWVSEQVKNGREVIYAVKKLNSLKALLEEYRNSTYYKAEDEDIDYDLKEED